MTDEQKVKFAILCAKEMAKLTGVTEKEFYKNWASWADKWMRGEDRSALSAARIETRIFELRFWPEWGRTTSAMEKAARLARLFTYPACSAGWRTSKSEAMRAQVRFLVSVVHDPEYMWSDVVIGDLSIIKKAAQA